MQFRKKKTKTNNNNNLKVRRLADNKNGVKSENPKTRNQSKIKEQNKDHKYI